MTAPILTGKTEGDEESVPPHEPAMRLIEDSRRSARRLWAEVLTSIHASHPLLCI